MKNMKIRRTLIIGFAIVLVITVIISGLGIVNIRNVNESYIHAFSHPTERFDILTQISVRMLDSGGLVPMIVLQAGNTEVISHLAQGTDSNHNQLLGYASAFRDNVQMDPRLADAEKTHLTQLMDQTEVFFLQFKDQVIDPVIAAARIGDMPAIGAALALEAQLRAQIFERHTAMVAEAEETLASVRLEAENTTSSVTWLLTIFAVAGVALGLTVALLISGSVSKGITEPLKNIALFMRQASTSGDLSLSEYQQKDIAERSQLKNEVGELYRTTAAFVMHVITMSEEINRMSNGDFSKNINALSDKDTIGIALSRMTDNLNDIFGEIKSSTSQVATGSKQVADGSQSLAQGSTEQAASVQQLSSSIAEIAEKTKSNSDMAEKAAMLADDIKVSAEKGSRQMDEMMTAVKEINDSSQNIGKVIKSIDDIAFQTNILALNAAVEAARAGQHGKGFAVVAEEVRNLAAKSAEAAKNTEGLIADSIEKAELGSRIADDTAASLTEIVNGIGESSALVSEIAKSSEEQNAGIDQINRGIDQVAQVTQQNSATAEQSAAASQEMSGQSDMLEELIARFKLKDDRRLANRNLPSAPAAAPEAAQAAPVDDAGYGKY